MLRIGLGDFGIAARGFAPLLLLEAKMPQPAVDVGRAFAAFCRAFQFLYRVLQLSFRDERDRFGQRRRRGGPLFLGRVFGRIPAQQFFNQIVVYEEYVLIVIFRHVFLYLFTTSGTTSTEPFSDIRSSRSLYSPTPPVFTRSSVHWSTF